MFFVKKLPKTRSGKIMRRLLKAVATDATLGDVTTLEDGASVDEVKAAYEALRRRCSRRTTRAGSRLGRYER